MGNNIIDEFFLREHADRIEKDHHEIPICRYIKNRGYHPNLSTLEINGYRFDEYPKRYIDIIGNVVTIRNIETPPPARKSVRGEIHNFRMKSRRNLQLFLQSIDWDRIKTERIIEIALTYSEEIPESGDLVKNHLHRLRKNIMDKYPGTILIWKLEFQGRSVPHYHIIMIAPEEIDLGDYQIMKNGEITYFDRKTKKHHETGVIGFRAYIQHRWNTIVEGPEKHFNAGIHADKVRNPKALPIYLAKYIAKERKADQKDYYQHKVPEWYKSVGRFWGCYNRKLLKRRKQRIFINRDTYEELSEYARNQWKEQNLPDYKGHEYGLTYFARGQDEINKEIMDIVIDNADLKN